MQPCKTGDQMYSDAPPNGECSLLLQTAYTQLVLSWSDALGRKITITRERE